MVLHSEMTMFADDTVFYSSGSSKEEVEHKSNKDLFSSMTINLTLDNIQKQPPEVFCKKGILINFASFTGKHLCHSLFFNKVAGLRSATLLKKRLWHRCFPVNVAKFLRTPFLQSTSRRMLLTKIDKTEEMLFRTSRKLAKCDTLNLSDSDLKINYATRYKCLGTYVDQTVQLNDYFEKNIQGNVFSSPSPVQLHSNLTKAALSV